MNLEEKVLQYLNALCALEMSEDVKNLIKTTYTYAASDRDVHTSEVLTELYGNISRVTDAYTLMLISECFNKAFEKLSEY